jgi:hypothetical protein
MSKIRAIETNEAENDETEVDPIEVIYQGECPSISGRSTLTYAIGRHSEDGKLHLAMTGNSGKGIFAADWAPASAIQEVVLGAFGLTAASFHGLHDGRSINTGGFILAALKALGLVHANAENTRIHEHVPGATFEKVVTTLIAQANGAKRQAEDSKTSRRKVKEID